MERSPRPGTPALPAALLASLLSLAIAAPASAEPHGIDTEHLFGFTEGSDIGVPGERELESETTGRLGKRAGRFRAFDSGLALKMPLQRFELLTVLKANDVIGRQRLADCNSRLLRLLLRFCGSARSSLQRRMNVADQRSEFVSPDRVVADIS